MTRAAAVLLLGLASCSLSSGRAHDAAPTDSAAIATPRPPPAPSMAPPLSDSGADDLTESRRDFYGWEDRMGADPMPKGKYVEDTFFLLSEDPAAPFDAAVEQTRVLVDAMWHGPMSRRLERMVPIWVYSTRKKLETALRKYRKGARLEGSGIYWKPTNEIELAVEGEGLGTLNRLLVQVLVVNDFADAPAWAVEGLGSLYEAADPSAPDAPHVLRPRLVHPEILRDALQSPSKAGAVRLDTLFGMTDDAFHADLDFNTARARETFRWLLQKGQLWDFYHRWRDDFANDRTGVKSFQKIAGGMTPAQANDAWVAWLQGGGAAK